jgi:hypothetical protein
MELFVWDESRNGHISKIMVSRIQVSEDWIGLSTVVAKNRASAPKNPALIIISYRTERSTYDAPMAPDGPDPGGVRQRDETCRPANRKQTADVRLI